MSDNEIHATKTRMVELPDDVDPNRAVWVTWPKTGYPDNLVIFREYGADAFVEATKPVAVKRDEDGRVIDLRTPHAMAVASLKVLVESIDGEPVGKFGPPRLLIPLADFAIGFASGDGLRPEPSAQP